ncbi:MAG TPA: glycosyltransferase family 39 protein, partial [Anaerolineales bacterium]|nr:glycosyltransferase family 39 protein [Anaerolineales bacterium]
MNTSPKEDTRRWYILATLAAIAGLAMRLQLASLAETPGHGDSAFYFTVAKNIVDGRGVVVDYVVYFFLGLVPLTHYAGDFWNPLAEILLSLPMFVFGKSLFSALLASIAAGMVPPLVAFFAGKRFWGSVRFGVLCGILTLFTPFLVVESVRTEAIIFFGAFGSLALFLAARGRLEPRYFVLAAMCTGLAHFVRQDGILLLLTLLACICIAPLPWRRKLTWAAAAVAVHVAMLSPLITKNLLTYGSPLQP